MADLVPEWYDKKREMMNDTLELVEENYPQHQIKSSHGSYAFASVPYCFSDDTSLFIFCSIASSNHDKPLDIIRDAPNFPYAWVKKHPKKRKYLVCGEDRLGITVVDLHSWKKHTWVEEGSTFCPKSFHPSRGGNIIAVRGNDFGELDTIRFYDFSSPIHFPWNKICTFPGMFIHDDVKYYPSYIPDWEGDQYLRVVCESDLGGGDVLLTEFMLYPDGDYIFDCEETISKD